MRISLKLILTAFMLSLLLMAAYAQAPIKVLIFTPEEIGALIEDRLPHDSPLLKIFKVEAQRVNKLSVFVSGLREKPTIVIAPVGMTDLIMVELSSEVIYAQDYLEKIGGMWEATYKSDTDRRMRRACEYNGKQLCFPLFAHSYILVSTGKPLPQRVSLREIAGKGMRLTSVFSPGELSLFYLSPLRSSDPLRGYIYWKLARAGSYKVAVVPAYVVPSVSVKAVPPGFSLYPINVERGVLNRIPFNMYALYLFKPSPEAKTLMRKYGERSYRATLQKLISTLVGFETQKELSEKFQVLPANRQVRLHPSYIKMVSDVDNPNLLWANNLMYKKPNLLPDEELRRRQRKLLQAMLRGDEAGLQTSAEDIAWETLEPTTYSKVIEESSKGIYYVEVLKGKERVALNRSSTTSCPAIKGLHLAIKLIEREVRTPEDLKRTIDLELPAKDSGERAETLKVKVSDVLLGLRLNDPMYIQGVKRYLNVKSISPELGALADSLHQLSPDRRSVLTSLWGTEVHLGSDEKSREVERKLPVVYLDLVERAYSLIWAKLNIRGKDLEYLIIRCPVKSQKKREKN